MKKLGLFCILFTLSTALFMPAMVQAKYVTIPDVDIVVTIGRDGSALIKENRTIDFNGDFTFGFYSIPISGFSSIDNISVSEGDQYYKYETSASKNPGTYTVTNTNDLLTIDYYLHAVDENRTFTICYEIKDVVKVFQDYGEFYWKLQGTGWDSYVDSFQANVQWTQPFPEDQYYIWAHGPIWGNFNKTNETSSFLQIDYLPRNTFVEVRVLLPSSYFTAPKLEGTIYETVLSEETELANASNAEREKAKAMDRKMIAIKFTISMIAIFFVCLYLLLFKKFGREYKITNASIYYREPPSNDKPAIIGMLCFFQKYKSKFLQATLMDLIRRKHIRYENNDGGLSKDHKLIRLQNQKDVLEDYETLLLDELLFENKHEVTTKSLKNKYRARNNLYHGKFQKFKQMIKDKSTEMGYFDKKSHCVSNISMGLGILLIFFGFFGGKLFSGFLFGNLEIFVMSLVPVGLLYVFGQNALRRRTSNGAEEFSKWKAFRSYLKDFTNLKEYGPDSIVIWEHFLVYATMFGFSTIVLRVLKIVVPKISDVNNGVLLGPALFVSGGFEYKSFNKEMLGISSLSGSLSRVYSSSNRRSGFGSGSRSSFSSSSSSSGSGAGGGFSSGGGGGGGGSGGGFG